MPAATQPFNPDASQPIEDHMMSVESGLENEYPWTLLPENPDWVHVEEVAESKCPAYPDQCDCMWICVDWNGEEFHQADGDAFVMSLCFDGAAAQPGRPPVADVASSSSVAPAHEQASQHTPPDVRIPKMPHLQSHERPRPERHHIQAEPSTNLPSAPHSQILLLTPPDTQLTSQEPAAHPSSQYTNPILPYTWPPAPSTPELPETGALQQLAHRQQITRELQLNPGQHDLQATLATFDAERRFHEILDRLEIRDAV